MTQVVLCTVLVENLICVFKKNPRVSTSVFVYHLSPVSSFDQMETHYECDPRGTEAITLAILGTYWIPS